LLVDIERQSGTAMPLDHEGIRGWDW